MQKLIAGIFLAVVGFLALAGLASTASDITFEDAMLKGFMILVALAAIVLLISGGALVSEALCKKRETEE